MKEDSLTAIAEKLHISKTTVSKVVRHCGGVDSETRNLVLQELKKTGYSSVSDCPIYCIVPDVPKYFWKEMLRGITVGEKPGLTSVKYNIYTKPSDEQTVLSYLEDAEKIGAKVIIIAANMTHAIRKKLESLQEQRLIILLSEYESVKNCFYVGADSFQNGYEMGRIFLERFAERRLLLFSLEDNPNAKKREAGFMQALCESQFEGKMVKIEISNAYMSGGKTFPARLASVLAQKAGCEEICIYSPVGMNTLPLAVHKAKLKENAVILCHDCYAEYQADGKQLYGGFSVTCNQDVFAQGLAAIHAANRYMECLEYPEKKENFLESHICQHVNLDGNVLDADRNFI